MLDRDEAGDLSFNPYSPINPSGLIGRTYTKMPTDSFYPRTAIPLINLDWYPYEMPKVSRKMKPPEIRSVSNWAIAQWNGQNVFRGVVSVDVNTKRFVYFAPANFPFRDTDTIEEQIEYFNSNS